MSARRDSTSTASTASSDTEERSSRERNFSETSREVSQIAANARPASATNTMDAVSINETGTERTTSPAVSQTSKSATGTAYDAASVTASIKTAVTSTTNTIQRQQVAGNIPIIRPPILQQQSTANSGIVGPQRPPGYPTNPPIAQTTGIHQQPIKIDVAAAQQQYQQRGGQPDVSPYSGSTASSSGGSSSSPGSASIQQQQQARVGPNQPMTNQASAQYQQQQQAQFANQIPAHEVYNELLGPDAFKDVILDIDYGAMGGFNAVFQSGTDFAGGQLPPGISVRPAYTTVDSLNYQQHMFNTARTINAGGENNNYDYSGMSSNYNADGFNNAYGASNVTSNYDVGGGQQFDVAKAIFNQADLNRDGTISREEFQQWTQNGQQNYGGQSYSATANYQTSGANYTNVNSGLYQATLFDGANPDVAKILQQSGLGQVVPN